MAFPLKNGRSPGDEVGQLKIILEFDARKFRRQLRILNISGWTELRSIEFWTYLLHPRRTAVYLKEFQARGDSHMKEAGMLVGNFELNA